MTDYQAITDELNERARNGELVAHGYVGLFGANHISLADGSASMRRVREGYQGIPGGAFYHIDGWELLRNNEVIVRWINQPQAYMRAARWMLLKARKQT